MKRKTMRKEKANLVEFLGWMLASGLVASIPEVKLPSGKGVAHPRMAKSGWGVVIPMTPLDAAKLVAVMPEWSSRASRNGGQRFLVRPFFEFVRLTGLRPVTVMRIEVPRNWEPGQKTLNIANVDDKADFGRELPLLNEAVAILETYAPEKGHIFGHHDFRKHVRAAAQIVFKDDPEKAARFGSYHFRHFVATFLANRAGTNLPGVQFALGHKDLTTTSGYVHADEKAAAGVLKGAEAEIKKASVAAKKWAAKRDV